MLKIIEHHNTKYVVRKVERPKKQGFPNPCFMIFEGYALCGVLRHGQSLSDFEKKYYSRK